MQSVTSRVYKLLTIVFLCTTIQSLYTDTNKCKEGKDVFSKTYLAVWPAYQINSPERVSMQHNKMKLYDDQRRHMFDITVFGGKSTDSGAIARYFAPFGKQELKVGELGTDWAQTGDLDVIANYFNIFTDAYPVRGNPYTDTISNYTFKSKVTFDPSYEYYGLGLHYRYHFSCDPEKGFFFDTAIPFMHVTTDMGMSEKIIQTGGPNGDDPNVPVDAVANMTQAFKQKDWAYGRIDGARSKLGVSDIQLGIGYTYVKEETHHLSSYTGLVIPTGNKPKGKYVFEPIVGNGGHTGIVFAMDLGFLLWGTSTQRIALELNTASTFFLHANQVRSFDLKNNMWSRYMFVYNNEKARWVSQGINKFSKEVSVGHGFVRNINLATTWTHCNGMQIEGGYQFFSRSTESVSLKNCWKTGPAIAALWNDDSGDLISGVPESTKNSAGISRNNATIKQYRYIGNDMSTTFNNFPTGDPKGYQTYKYITDCDLDLESAVTPAIMTHTFYASIGRYWDHLPNPKFAGLGFSYEFSDDNTAIDRWMLWGKIGFTF